MPITHEEKGEAFLLQLKEEVGVSEAAELRTVLLHGLAAGKNLRVNLEAATDLDITVWQLLWAAAREAAASNVSCSIDGRLPAPIAAGAIDAGFSKFPISEEPK